MTYLSKNWLPLLVVFAFAGCGEQEVLLTSLTRDGGVYYHEGKPYSGIGFSNWTPEIRKKTIGFKNGEIRKIVRYYSFQGKPMDSLLFDENRFLIYQKRWVNDTLFVEKKGYENNIWYSMLFNPLANLGDSIHPIQDKYNFLERFVDSGGNLNFDQFLDSLRIQYSFDHTFIFNSLGPAFGPNNKQRRTFPDMLAALGDLHFSGGGNPEIDGQYKYPSDLYLSPLYGGEDDAVGVFLDLYCDDDRGVDYSNGWGRSKRTFHRVPVYATGANLLNPEYYNFVANNFCIIDSLGPNSFRVFLRPDVNPEIDILEDEYRPLILVLEMDFNPHKISPLRAEGYGVVGGIPTLNPFNVSVYALGPSFLYDQRMSLSIEPTFHEDKYGRKSEFDAAVDTWFKSKTLVNKYLAEPGTPFLRKYFDMKSQEKASGANAVSESVDSNNSDERTRETSDFWIVVKEGKSNVNVRRAAPAGKVIGTVNAGDRILASKSIQLSEPLYLLKNEVLVTSMDGERTYKRAANYQLYNVESFEKYVEADIKDDNNETVRVKVPIGDVDLLEQDVWYYLPELDGYIFGGLVRRE